MCWDDKDYDKEAEYIAQNGTWLDSFHIHAAAVMIQRDIAVIHELEDTVDFLACSGDWTALRGDQLANKIRGQSQKSPVQVICNTGHDHNRHYHATQPTKVEGAEKDSERVDSAQDDGGKAYVLFYRRANWAGDAAQETVHKVKLSVLLPQYSLSYSLPYALPYSLPYSLHIHTQTHTHVHTHTPHTHTHTHTHTQDPAEQEEQEKGEKQPDVVEDSEISVMTIGSKQGDDSRGTHSGDIEEDRETLDSALPEQLTPREARLLKRASGVPEMRVQPMRKCRHRVYKESDPGQEEKVETGPPHTHTHTHTHTPTHAHTHTYTHIPR
jgi:hypothetical protein